MAIGDDFTINVAGDIRADSPAATYTVLELHRWLQDLADNQSTAGAANDILDITSLTPSSRSTDEIITLINGYNIDDAAAEWFYGGSIKQGSGATETIYSGLRILGSVIDTGTQIQVIQDKALYDGDVPFWGDQVSPFNGGGAVLARFLVKSRENGCDIDEQKILVQARNYGDSFSEFSVTLGEGEAVAAISTVDDPQNDTAQGTVTAYTHVTNTEGFQQIDIGDGNGNQPYYSKWTYGADTSGDQLKGVWEFCKDLVSTGTAKTIHGIDGELFRGITHTYVYDNISGNFAEDEEVIWGTGVTYDTLAGGTFTVGNYIRFGTGGNAGRIMYDNGSTFCIVALEDISGTKTPVDTEVMTEYAVGTGATGVTAAVDTTTPVADPTKAGGLGLLLADDETGLKHHIQLRLGSAPVNNLPVRGLTSAATADVNATITARTVNPVFLGSYVGTMIGGFGVGFLPADLTASDTVIDLDGDTNTPPNNVTWTLGGLVSGEDYVLVGPKAAGNDFLWAHQALNATMNTGTETSVVVTAIPDNTPQVGTLRITLDDGRRRRQAYTSHNGTTTYTIASADYLDPDDATTGNDVMSSYLDLLATSGEEAFTTIFDSADVLWVRVRDGGAGKGDTPIKTFEVQSNLSATGGSATAVRIEDD